MCADRGEARTGQQGQRLGMVLRAQAGIRHFPRHGLAGPALRLAADHKALRQVPPLHPEHVVIAGTIRNRMPRASCSARMVGRRKGSGAFGIMGAALSPSGTTSLRSAGKAHS